MATTFARLCQQVDQTQKELEAEIRRLTANIDQLEHVQSHSKTMRSVDELSGGGGALCPPMTGPPTVGGRGRLGSVGTIGLCQVS